MATRSEIEQRYQSDMRLAEEVREHDGERYNVLTIEAERRKSGALDELSRDSELASARLTAQAKFPLADPELVAGTTPEEILANAEKIHNFADKNRKDAAATTRASSRAETAQQYGPRGVLPRSEIAGQGQAADRSADAAKRLNDAIASGDEMETIAAMRAGGKLSGLDRWASETVAAAKDTAEE